MTDEPLIDLPLSNCKNCPIYDPKNHHPHNYWGNLDDPEVLFVNESPNPINPRTGKQHNSQDSMLLKRRCTEVGITNFAVYNLVACYAEKENKWGKMVQKKPAATEIKCCFENLEAVINTLKPKFIVPLGAKPTKRLKVKGKFMTSRGIVHDTPYGKVFPVLSPGYILRSPNYVDDLVGNLKILKKLIDGNYIRPKPKGKYLLADTLPKVEMLINALFKAHRFSFDIETTGLVFYRNKILGIGFSPKGELGYYIPINVKSPDGDIVSYWPKDIEDKVVGLIKNLMEDPYSQKVAHNGKFDLKNLKYHWDIDAKNFYIDTMLLHYLIDENRKHGLTGLAAKYYPEMKNYDAELQRQLSQRKQDEENFADADLETVSTYCATDCDITQRLSYTLYEEADEQARNLLHNFYMPLSNVYMKSELVGVKIDIPYAKKTLAKYEKLAAEELQKVYDIAGEEFNLRSPKQMAHILFDKLNFPIIVKTDSGNPSTAEGTLKEMPKNIPHREIIDHILNYRGYDKMISTYLKSFIEKADEDGRIHPGFLLHGTVTGRLSSKGPNIQNIPRNPEIKGMIIPEDDYLLVEADYSQAELRVMAYYSGDREMTKAYKNGEDIHRKTASQAFKKPPEEIDKKERKKAKLVNFGYVYGATAAKATASINEKAEDDSQKVTLKEMEFFRTEFFKLYSGVMKYIKQTHRVIQRDKQVTSIFGRRRRLPQIKSPIESKQKEALREGLNAIIQGTASDLTQMALIKIDQLFEGYKSRFLYTVHDAIICEIHKSEHFLIPKIKEIMETPPDGFDFPLVADTEIYQERWSKDVIEYPEYLESLPVEVRDIEQPTTNKWWENYG